MIIKKITIQDFMGMKGNHEFDLPQLCGYIAPNGTGKTSLINAIRFVLTGAEPAGDIINNSAKECWVGVVLDSGNKYEKGKIQGAKGCATVCKINNNKVTKIADFNQAIEEETGASIDTLTNVLSLDIFKDLNTKEFGNFVLKFIPEKLTKEAVMGFIPKTTFSQMKIIDEILPDAEITQGTLEAATTTLTTERKALNSEKKKTQALFDALDIPSDLEQKSALEITQTLGATKNRLSNLQKQLGAFSTRQKLLMTIAENEKSLLTYQNATIPDEALKTKLLQHKKELENEQSEKLAIVKASEQSNRTLAASLGGLKNNKCPFSDKLVCSTEKTPLIKSIQETMQQNEQLIEIQKKKLSELEEQIVLNDKKLNEFEKNRLAFDRKIYLQKAITQNKEILNQSSGVAESEEDIKSAIQDEQVALKNLEAALQKKTISQKLQELSTATNDYDNLTKAFSIGGEVYTKVLSYYSDILDEAVEGLANTMNMKMHFKPEKGLSVMVDVGNGMVDYDCLSKGEQTNVLFVTIDLINKLTNANILILDETSVLDKNAYERLLEAVVTHKNEYNNIILAGVNNEELLEKKSIINIFKKEVG